MAVVGTLVNVSRHFGSVTHTNASATGTRADLKNTWLIVDFIPAGQEYTPVSTRLAFFPTPAGRVSQLIPIRCRPAETVFPSIGSITQ